MTYSGARLIRGREVDKRIGCGTTKRRQMVKSGTFPPPAMRMGEGPTSPWMWLEADVDVWIAKQLGDRRKAAA